MSAPMLSYSPFDSERFCLQVFRADVADFEPKALANEIFSTACDVAIVRVPSRVATNMSALSRWALPVIHADTLVRYKCDLLQHSPPALLNTDLTFSVAKASEAVELRDVVADIFRSYSGHYAANHLFPRDRILMGYQEWAERSIVESGCTLWLARRGGNIVAFAACHINSETGVADGILYGVNPDLSGRGIFTDLIRYTQAEAKKIGMHSMGMSSTIGNLAVQKVWVREGFYMIAAQDTFHINAMLSGGECLVDRSIEFDAGSVNRFAQATGGTNPILIDTASAQAAEFPDRVVHGVMSAAELSRILGTEVPGAGTILGQLNIAFIKPIVVGSKYHLRMKAPNDLKVAGQNEVIVTVTDNEGQICLYGRAHIFTKRR